MDQGSSVLFRHLLRLLQFLLKGRKLTVLELCRLIQVIILLSNLNLFV